MDSKKKKVFQKAKTFLFYFYVIFLAIDILIFVPYWCFNYEKIPAIVADVNEFILAASFVLPLFIFGLCYGVCFICDVARGFVAPDEDK